MVLGLRNAFSGRSSYSLASALVYQVARRPQSGVDRLSDTTFKICFIQTNEDIDLALSSFVSQIDSKVLVHKSSETVQQLFFAALLVFRRLGVAGGVVVH